MDSWTPEDATAELMAVLPLLNRIVAAEVRREAGEETTMPQFRVLAYLLASPLTPSALARKRRVSLQSMGELVQVLVERGWISRSPDPNDRRQHLLQITDQGRVHYERAQEHALQRLVPLLTELSSDEMAAVQTALAALRRVLTREESGESDGIQST